MQSTRHDIGTTGTVHEVPSADGEGTVWVGAVGHPVDETPEELGFRWDEFARTMFRHGLEPSGDEPAFTTRVGGTHTDHYLLQEVSSFFGMGWVAALVLCAEWFGRVTA